MSSSSDLSIIISATLRRSGVALPGARLGGPTSGRSTILNGATQGPEAANRTLRAAQDYDDGT